MGRVKSLKAGTRVHILESDCVGNRVRARVRVENEMLGGWITTQRGNEHFVREVNLKFEKFIKSSDVSREKSAPRRDSPARGRSRASRSKSPAPRGGSPGRSSPRAKSRQRYDVVRMLE